MKRKAPTMLSFAPKNKEIICYADREDIPTTPEKIVEALADSIDVDFVGVENEGAPVFLGNSYAEYQIRVLMPQLDGKEHTIGIGPNEADVVNREQQVRLTLLD
jgi:hypothetical protein